MPHIPFGVDMDLLSGALHNPAHHLVRKASDMRGYYADANALDALIRTGNDPLHYEVFEAPIPRESGDLMVCISALQPGRVGEECFMTKGHYHTIARTAEVYLCLRGEGLMLMKTAGGDCAVETMARGRMVYVPPGWAHRSVNTGPEPLVCFCVYPADAGHNYGDIEVQGFPKRVIRKNGDIQLLETAL
ncbi:MAG: cupin domain-containing protein [Kiritimatiellae bacterium]|nr:cupin domain-containing protein [Kiritimatiellia bacterium]